MPWRISGSSSTFTPTTGAPTYSRIWITWPENPHCGNSGVPFMNRTTGFSEISFSIRSRAFAIALGPHRSGESRSPPSRDGYSAGKRSLPADRSEKEALSAAGRVHMTVNGGRRRSGDDEIVAFGLTLYTGADRLDERPAGSGKAKRLSQIDRILLAETHIERACAG